jgi:hypothetical protein
MMKYSFFERLLCMRTLLSPYAGTDLHEQNVTMDIHPRSHYLAEQGYADAMLLAQARTLHGDKVVGVEIKYPRSWYKPATETSDKEKILYGIFSQDNELLIGGFTTLAEARGVAAGIVEQDRFKTSLAPTYEVQVKLYIGKPDVFTGFPPVGSGKPFTVAATFVTLILSENAVATPTSVQDITELSVGDVLSVGKRSAQVHPVAALLVQNSPTQTLSVDPNFIPSNQELVSTTWISGGVNTLKKGEENGFLPKTVVFGYEAINRCKEK